MSEKKTIAPESLERHNFRHTDIMGKRDDGKKKHLFTTSTSTARKILENSVNVRLYTSRFTLWFLKTYLSNLLAPGYLLRDRGRGRDHHGFRPRSRRDHSTARNFTLILSYFEDDGWTNSSIFSPFSSQMSRTRPGEIFLPHSSVIWKSI